MSASAAGASFSGAGTTLIAARTFSIDGPATAASLTQSGGTLSGAADLTVSGAYTWSGGTMSGAVRLVLPATGQMNIVGNVTAGRTIDNTAAGSAINWSNGELFGTLTNLGQFNIDSSVNTMYLGTLNNSGTMTWSGIHDLRFDGGTINNQSAGTFDVQDDHLFFFYAGSPSFNNAGLFKKTAGSGISTVNIPFANSGTIEVLTGTLNLNGGFSNFSGTTLTGGTYIVSGTLGFSGRMFARTPRQSCSMARRAQILNSSTSANALANFATNASGGSFTIQNGRNLTTAGAFSNAGNLAIGTSSTFTTTGNYTQTAGDTDLQGGTLAATGLVDLQGGVLSGSGAVNANVNNAAQVGPGDSAGTISITGNYTQTSAGALNIELGGASAGQFDVLQVTGTATLDGTLNVSLINGYVPTPPDAFQVLTFGSRSGDFATKNGLELGGGKYLSAAYNSSSLTLTTFQATITVTPTSGLETSEAGGQATFTVVLGSQPTADVTISLHSSNTTEGTVSPSSLTFTPANWNSRRP